MKNLSLFFLILFVVACGGKEADFEEAEYLIGTGNAGSGAKAQSLMEPYLESGDIGTRMRAHRLYAGAIMNQAGFSPASFISRLVERDENQGTIQTLKRALTTLENGSQARATLARIAAPFSDLYANADFQAINLESSEGLIREKRAVFLSEALNRLLYTIILGAIDSRLLDLDLSRDNITTSEQFQTACQESLATDDENTAYNENQTLNLLRSLVYNLRIARLRLINAGLSDVEQKAQAIAADVDLSPFAGDTADNENNTFNDFIQDLQVEVDTDHDGEPGAAGDIEEYDFEDLCDFLENEELGGLSL